MINLLAFFLVTALLVEAPLLPQQPRSEYVHLIQTIVRKEEAGHVFISIELSDGSIWKWVTDSSNEHLLRRWDRGDEVWLLNPDSAEFQLYNLAKPRFAPSVSLVSKSQVKLLTIDELSMDGRYFMLSDGSEWHIAYDFQNNYTRDWEIGDLIFPSKCTDKNYSIINIDVPFDPRKPNHRQVNAVMQFEPSASADADLASGIRNKSTPSLFD